MRAVCAHVRVNSEFEQQQRERDEHDLPPAQHHIALLVEGVELAQIPVEPLDADERVEQVRHAGTAAVPSGPKRVAVLEQIRERREGERHPFDAALRAPRDDLGDEPFVDAVRRVCGRGSAGRATDPACRPTGSGARRRSARARRGRSRGRRRARAPSNSRPRIIEKPRASSRRGCGHQPAQLEDLPAPQVALAAQNSTRDAGVAAALDRLAQVAERGGRGRRTPRGAPRRRGRSATPHSPWRSHSGSGPLPRAEHGDAQPRRRRASSTKASMAAGHDSASPTGSPLATAVPQPDAVADRRVAVRRERRSSCPDAARTGRADRPRCATRSRTCCRRPLVTATRASPSEQCSGHLPAGGRHARVVRAEQVEVLDQPLPHRFALVAGDARRAGRAAGAARAATSSATKARSAAAELARDVVRRGSARDVRRSAVDAARADRPARARARRPRCAGSASRIAWKRCRGQVVVAVGEGRLGGVEARVLGHLRRRLGSSPSAASSAAGAGPVSPACGAGLQDGGDELAHLGLGQRALEAGHELAADHREHGRDALHLQRLRDARVGVDVDLGEHQRARCPRPRASRGSARAACTAGTTRPTGRAAPAPGTTGR